MNSFMACRHLRRRSTLIHTEGKKKCAPLFPFFIMANDTCLNRLAFFSVLVWSQQTIAKFARRRPFRGKVWNALSEDYPQTAKTLPMNHLQTVTKIWNPTYQQAGLHWWPNNMLPPPPLFILVIFPGWCIFIQADLFNLVKLTKVINENSWRIQGEITRFSRSVSR